MRIRSFDHCCVSCQASAASRTLRAIVLSLRLYAFLTYCCVIVDPPSTTALLRMSSHAARRMPRTSTPLCSKNRLSSVATIACFMIGAISSDFTSTRLSSPRRIASTRRWPDLFGAE